MNVANRKARIFIAAIVAFTAAGCSNIPIFVKHDASKLGVKSEVTARITSREMYRIGQYLPKISDTQWVETCRTQQRPCQMPGRYRLKIFKNNDPVPFMDIVVKNTFYATLYDTTTSVRLGTFFYKGYLDVGNYKISIENLENNSEYGNGKSEFFIQYVIKKIKFF